MDTMAFNIRDGLELKFDYFRFTILDPAYDVLPAALALFGYKLAEFEDMPGGGHGYKSMKRLPASEVYVYYEGAEGMGIHFDVRGSAISGFLSSYASAAGLSTPFGSPADSYCNVARSFMGTVLEHGRFSRLDIAIDNRKEIYFTPAEVHGLYSQGLIVTYAQQSEYILHHDRRRGIDGCTFHIGSRKSDTFLRIYDKRAEQMSKHPDLTLDEPWIRWELEFKGKKPDAVARLFLNGLDSGGIAVGLLSGFMRIIVNDDSNRSRCSLNERWARFLDGVAALKPLVPVPEKSFERSLYFCKKQWAQFLACLVMRDGGSLESIYDILSEGRKRLRPGAFERYVRGSTAPA